MPVLTPDQAKQLAQIRAQNQAVLAATQWVPVQFANSLANTSSATYALGTRFVFTLQDTSGFLKKIRILHRGTKISNSSTSTAGALNRNGFYQLLGSLIVRLGNHIYRVPAGAIPLLYQTYRSRGDTADYRGNQSYTSYSSTLFAAASSIAASGNTTYEGYIDIPLSVLECVYDPDGIAPTLANTGIQVEFTTPASGDLQGTDPFVNPFGSAGTLTLTTGGTITVWGYLARQVSVASNGALPPFVVGSAFVYEDVPQAWNGQGPNFYTFQGQDSALILVKSIVVLDSPGELTGEFSDPNNLAELSLMYDQNSAVYENDDSQQPYFNSGGTGGLTNWMIEQGQAIGDQPPGVYVFDFGRGTDPNYPNSSVYANLEQFTKAGIRVRYATGPQTGAQIHFLNQYLVPNFYKALKAA